MKAALLLVEAEPPQPSALVDGASEVDLSAIPAGEQKNFAVPYYLLEITGMLETMPVHSVG